MNRTNGTNYNTLGRKTFKTYKHEPNYMVCQHVDVDHDKINVISNTNPLNDWPTINANTLYMEGCFAKAQPFTSPLSQHVKISIA